MSNAPVNSSSTTKTTLVLFHNDLRVDDNATLAKAAQLADNNNGHLLLVYAQALVDSSNPNNWSQAYHFDEMGDARRQFLVESLVDLDQSLKQLGNRLLCLKNDGFQQSNSQDESAPSDTFTQLCQLIEAQQVTDICVSQSADYAQNQAYKALQDKYPNIDWHVQAVTTLFDDMPTKVLPQSFTQFRKKVEYEHDLLTADFDLVIAQTPALLPAMPDALVNNEEDNELFFSNQCFNNQSNINPQSQFKGGETSAIEHLNSYFDSDAPSTYKETRNTLDDWMHSTKFSAWLANGSLSVKVLLNRLRHYEREVVANDSTYWIWFELLWREYFYWYSKVHQEQLFTFQGISNHKPTTLYDNRSGKASKEQRLIQWQKGETAYPIVNACMKQLNSTGYMSNRGRQIVASAFIHELGLDWRYGATYFEQQLIDYDVASNWGNWQYLAGVGADPRGCRQFNLSKQTQQHDPKNEFIDRWA